jgi:hypothetical protein
MNPYDFVPLDKAHPPRLKRPIWHHVLVPDATHSGKLYSGSIYLYLRTETPLFIRDADESVDNPRYPGQHIRNKAGEYIIPGTSLKGLLRNVVETLCGGCLTGSTYYSAPVPFLSCQDHMRLCISCRLFGMMQRGQNARVFRGKVNIGDARVYEDSLDFYKPIYTAVLDSPKPRHRAFYLNPKGEIAGRKFYFHHSGDPRTESRLLEIRNKPGEYRNQHIQPLASNTEFDARIDFTNLEPDEFAALLYAVTLLPAMRHKIGYGKPIGLGSIRIDATELRLVDYATRYTQFRAARGFSTYTLEDLPGLLAEQMNTLDPQICTAWQEFQSFPALSYLSTIWQWKPDSSVVYFYPGQRWFKEHPQARLEETRDLYPGE